MAPSTVRLLPSPAAPAADEWASQGACRTADPDELFVQGAAQNKAKTICSGCVVRTECLSDALDSRVEFGVWGGMTERERRALLRRRPDVTSWRALFEQARLDHARQAEALASLPQQQQGLSAAG